MVNVIMLGVIMLSAVAPLVLIFTTLLAIILELFLVPVACTINISQSYDDFMSDDCTINVS